MQQLKMYSQFERQYSNFLREHLATLDLTQHRSSESDVLDYLTHNFIKRQTGNRQTEDKQTRDKQRDQSSTNNFIPSLNRSYKSDELARAHVEFARELLGNEEYGTALGELSEAIRNATTLHTLITILSVRLVVLFKLNLLHEFVSDLRLFKVLCKGDVSHPILELCEEVSTLPSEEFNSIIKTFSSSEKYELDRNTEESYSKLHLLLTTNVTKLPLQETLDCYNPQRTSLHVPTICKHLQGYDCVNDVVRIESSQERGRYVAAEHDLEIGDVIAMEEASVATVLPEKWASHCQYCLNSCRAPLPCLSCPDVVYCTVKCLQRDNSHKMECGYMSELQTLPKMVYLAFRTVGTFKEDIIKQSQDMDTSVSFQRVCDLITNLEQRPPIDIIRRASLAIFLTNLVRQLHIFDGDVTFCDGSLDGEKVYSTVECVLLKCLQSYPCNAHEISELQIKQEYRYSLNEDIGAGVFPFLSLLNHSCNPNVVRHSVGTSTLLRVLRKVGGGEELLDNYGYHYATHLVPDRRKALRSQYLFDCSCEPCLNKTEWPLFPSVTSEVKYRCKNCDVRIAPKHQPKCRKCGRKFSKIVQKVENLAAGARKFVQMFVENGDMSVDRKPVFTFLQVCEEYTVPPFRLYNECQEVVKQIWNMKSNRIYQL